MSTEERDGGPAFPQMVSRLQWDADESIKRTMIDSTGGMSLRDYFAGQVLASQIDDDRDADLAARCYALADAMLAERAK